MKESDPSAPLLLSPLYKWAHRQQENFCSEVLAGLIRVGLERSHNSTLQALSDLFGVALVAGGNAREIQVTTQFSIPTGRIPDLAVQGSDAFLLIEAKVGSQEGPDQLKDYGEYLRGRQDVRTKSLVYLTTPFERNIRAPSSLGSDVTYRHLRWRDTLLVFQGIGSDDPVLAFLTHEFEGLLRQGGLMVDKVSKGLVPGAQELLRLRDMLSAALSQSDLLGKKTTQAAYDYIGWYVMTKGRNRLKVWVGFFFDTPGRVWFQFQGAVSSKTVEEIARKGGKGVHSGVHQWISTPSPYLDLESCGFFELNSDEQAQLLGEFLETALRVIA